MDNQQDFRWWDSLDRRVREAGLLAVGRKLLAEGVPALPAGERDCPDCDGGLAPVPVFGSWREEPYEYVTCRRCKGTGIVRGVRA